MNREEAPAVPTTTTKEKDEKKQRRGGEESYLAIRCQFCPSTFVTYDQFRMHVIFDCKIFKNANTKPFYRCSDCLAMFWTAEDRDSHAKDCYPEEDNATANEKYRLFPCRYCDVSFSGYGSLRNHLCKCHVAQAEAEAERISLDTLAVLERDRTWKRCLTRALLNGFEPIEVEDDVLIYLQAYQPLAHDDLGYHITCPPGAVEELKKSKLVKKVIPLKDVYCCEKVEDEESTDDET